MGAITVDVVVDPSRRGVTEAARQFARARILAEPATSSTLTDLDVDIVDICTPGPTHGELAIAALAHGFHTMVEKPLCHSTDELRTICAAALDGPAITTFQTMRLSTPVERARAAICSGTVGRISRVNMTHRARHILNEAEWVTSRPDGVLFENAIHFVDMAHHLLSTTDDMQPIRLDAIRFFEADHQPILTGVEMLGTDRSGRRVTIDFVQDTLVHSGLQSRVYICGTGSDLELAFYPAGFRAVSGAVDPLHDVSASVRRLFDAVQSTLRPQRALSTPHGRIIRDFLEVVRTRREPLVSIASLEPTIRLLEEASVQWTARHPQLPTA